MSVTVVEPFSKVEFFGTPLARARAEAQRGVDEARRFVADGRNRAEVECALRIRAVENALYELFGKGKLHGTIHTCVGQEFSGAMLGKHLRATDYVTSNHRCHGHFIGATGNWRGLIDELVGNRDGVCAGIGSSQHLWAENFISNGQQGGLLPVAAGVALDRKTRGESGVVVSFMGEGTLGEGIVYETLNLDVLWGLPHVVICENNFYSQSTAQGVGVAGSIAERAAGFGLSVAEASTWDLPAFDRSLRLAFERARTESEPTFILLSTYRLNPHSKGDDLRDRGEIDWFAAHDPATLALEDHAHFGALYRTFVEEAAEHAAAALDKPLLATAHYFPDQCPRHEAAGPIAWTKAGAGADTRLAQQLNAFYHDRLETDRDAFFLGEDIADPYGGAFKVAKGLTTAFGARVRTTPISEAAIVGAAIGLAISGHRSFVEIMFGDFITYAFDQIINNASKMFHMYNRKLDCPVVIRAPMGGRRGYGPTHSQSLERFLIGIDNCCTLSLNSLVPVDAQLAALPALRCPAILLENKIDYAAKTFSPPDGIAVEVDDAAWPTVRLRLEDAKATLTLVAYGGMARYLANGALELFERTDTVFELIAPTSLSPLNLAPIAESVRRTGRLIVVEEGPGFGSLGAELIAQLHDSADSPFTSARVGGKPAPIPSPPHLEAAALPSVDDVCAAIEALKGRQS